MNDKSLQLEAVVFMLYLETWLDIDEDLGDLDEEVINTLHDKWINEWIPASKEPHYGDCTNMCCACIRCNVETLYKTAEKFVQALNSKRDKTNAG